MKSAKSIAKEVFNFEILQSCSVLGIVQDPEKEGENISLGMLAVRELQKMYKDKYYDKSKKGKLGRRRIHYPNSIGGDQAHPIWRFKETVLPNNIKVDIWRVQ